MIQAQITKLVYLIIGISLAISGLWMLVQPEMWYNYVAVNLGNSEPFNAHLVRELGGSYLVIAALCFWCLANFEQRFPTHWIITTFFSALAGIYLADIYTGHIDLDFKSAQIFFPALILVFCGLPLEDWFAAKRQHGKVKWFNKKKGFGFIVTDDNQEVFVHFRSIRGGKSRTLRDGQEVEFTLTQGEKGPQAEDVEPL